MHIVWMIIVGFFIGLIAKFLMPGRQGGGFILTSLLGIIGSVVGTFIGQGLGWYNEGEPAGFIASVVGAMIFLLIARSFSKK